MSNYTTELRFVCETLAGYDMSQGYGKVSDIIDKSWDKVFDFHFPIFDNSYKEALCKKILMHYYTREIGFETVGLWKLKLETKMNEIMPYYNKLYESETYKFNPLYDMDYTKTHEGEDSGTSEDSSSHTGTVGDSGTHGGTVGDSGTHGGTVGDSGTHGGTVGDSGTHGGTVGDSGTHGGSVTDSGTHGGTISDEYRKEGNVDDTKHNENEDSTWDVYSDTPQGALTNVANDTYLTNARKINKNGEEDGTNNRDYDEEGSSTRTFNETNGNTRTYNETESNTRTYNETQNNTRTYNETNANTRTYNETSGNTRTYNETTGNTRTFNEGNDTDRSFSNTNEYVEHVMGKSGGKSYTSMIMEYRESLLNIDMMVIKELNGLFMLLW